MSSYAERIRGAAGFSSSRPDSVRVVSEIADQTHRLREMGWNLTVAAMERFAGHRRGLGNKDFHMSASVRDLVARTGKGARSEVDAFAQSVMRAGHYTKDEAARAVRSVVVSLEERVPPEVLLRLADCLHGEEAEVLRARVERRSSL